MHNLLFVDVFISSVKPEYTCDSFTRVTLQPGETRRVSLEITPKAMRTLDRNYRWVVESGVFRVFLADNTENFFAQQEFTVVTK